MILLKIETCGKKLSSNKRYVVPIRLLSTLVRVFVFFLLYLPVYSGIAEDIEKNECQTQAKTEFESTLCKIKTKDPSATLPNLNEFRKNNSKMQYLLLKRPAKRLGISLNKPEGLNKKNKMTAPISSSDRKASNNQTSDTIKIAPPSSISFARPTIDSPNVDLIAEKKLAGGTNLKQCRLLEKSITCPIANYSLVTNKPLKSIGKEFLSSDNQLIVEQATTAQTDLRYNTRVYRTYIEKMLSIGLGYSTMSFTKFSYIQKDSIAQGENFAERLFDMFELLKQERKTNAIKARYDNKMPESTNWCMNLSDTLIVCDNKKQNWIYKRAH